MDEAIIPLITADGAFGGDALAYLNSISGKNIAAPVAPLAYLPQSTADGKLAGKALAKVAADFANGVVPVVGPATSLPFLDEMGHFTGDLNTWLTNWIGTDGSERYVAPTSYTKTVDPRTYLTGGQTWTTVADIRSAFQSALNDAHTHAFASANNTVKFIIPPGVGQLTSSVAQAPINYDSATTGNRLPTTIGFGLRPNMPGKIVFMGSGGHGEDSTIRLSNNAHCLFFANTDGGTSGGTAAGYTWTKVYTSEPGNQGMRPNALMCFQNYDFVGFCVDNQDALNPGANVVSRAHVVFGCMPAAGWTQPYASFYNLNHSDIRAIGFNPNPSATDTNTSSQLLFSYRTKHTNDHEPTNGVGVNVWNNWNLTTISGRQAAFNAKWTFMYGMNFYDVEAINSTRAIHVTGDRTPNTSNVMAMWFDEINLYRCIHTQPQPYTYWAHPTTFIIGAGCMGGTARSVDCVSENVGDNPIEMGAFQTRIITNLKSNNSRMAGILLTNTQSPPNPDTAIVLIDGYTHTITADNIVTQPRSPGIEFDNEADGLNIPIHATITNTSMVIDGGSSKVSLGNLVRKNRFGWQLQGPVGKLNVDTLSLSIKNVSTPTTYLGAGDANNSPLDKTLPLIYYNPTDFDTTQATCVMKNVSITIEAWVPGTAVSTTTAVPCRVIGVQPVTSGSFNLSALTLTINNIAGVSAIDVVTVGAMQTEWARTNASGNGTRREFYYTSPPTSFPATTTGENTNYTKPNGTYTISNINATRTGASQPATRRMLVVQKQNPINAINYSGLNSTAWGTGAVTLTSDVVPNDAFTETATGSGLYYWPQRNTQVTVT